MGNMADLIEKNCFNESVHGITLEAVKVGRHLPVDTPLQFVTPLVRESLLEMGVRILPQDDGVVGVNFYDLKALTADGFAIQSEDWDLVQTDYFGRQDDKVPKHLLPLFNGSELSIDNLI